MKMIQKLIILREEDGECKQFFQTKDPTFSLHTYLENGWLVKWVDRDARFSSVLLEKEIEGVNNEQIRNQ